MSLKKFLTSRVFFIQVLIAIVLVVVLIWITMFGLKIYTKNGQSNPVPDFYALDVTQVEALSKQYNLQFEIIDSSFNNDVPPGTVIDQVPEKGFKVKDQRTIFLTLNSTMPEQVSVPKLTEISFRQAQVLIENCGLQIGTISYSPSEYNDLVLKVLQDSIKIKTGQKLVKGSVIDLVVGRVEGNITTPLPNLIGLTLPEAQELITNAMLNTGVFIYDQSVLSPKDSLNVKVWKQNPSPKINAEVNLGSSIDLWLTIDQLKIDDAIKPNF